MDAWAKDGGVDARDEQGGITLEGVRTAEVKTR